jgi:tetratricopeptide (TPR) repeat protein/DNA-binding XRE family transcriptional regulator
MSTSRGKLSGPRGIIRLRRIEAGLTQEQLAELSGLSIRAISDIERGITIRPHRSSVALLEAALDLAGPDRETVPADPHAASPVPRQLPQAVSDFVGRMHEQNVLTDLFDTAGSTCGPIVISAIAGTGGVGKTALAVHWAHRAAERFPDGQLYANLRGYDPDRPVAASDALTAFLRALGVVGQDIPPEEDERAALFRSLLAGRRMLIVLDNARSAEQVRPLLPGAPASVVLVTSRDALTGLVARDGATRLDLDLLPLADAVALLRALIGERVDADPGAAQALAAHCSWLPLALRVAAEMAAARPGVPLAAIAAELADQRRQLDLLDAGGDPRTGLRAVFSWSYRNLDAITARTFRLLGLHPGSDVDARAAAALAGTTVPLLGPVLDMLVRAHLLQFADPGRYRMHDLLRTYARELAAASDTEDAQQAALTRLFDHYLCTAAAAMNVLFPSERHRRPDVGAVRVAIPRLADADAARAWLDAERANLVAAAAHAASHGWPGHVIGLAATLFRYLESAGHYPDIVAINTHASRAARDTGDRAAEAEALNNLTIVDLQQGRYTQAIGQLEQALALYRETSNQAGEARALGNLGIVLYQQGRYAQAIGYQQQALKLRRARRDRAGEANTLNNLGIIDLRQGRYAQAAGHLGQAMALYREIGDRDGEAYALSNLGDVNARQGSHRRAARHLERALALFRKASDPVGEANALTNLGTLSLLRGRYPQAGDHYRKAVNLSRKIGDQSSQAEALNGLGETLLATGRAGDARAEYDIALRLADQIGDKYQQARAYDGLARAHHAVGRSGQARSHWRKALTLYADLGTPEADQVRSRLGQVPAG